MGEERLEAFFWDDLGALSPILDSIPLGIMISDASGACLYLNHECTSITGYTLEDARADRTIFETICSAIAVGTPTADQPCDLRKGTVVDAESLIHCKDGRVKGVRLRAVSVARGCTIISLRPKEVAKEEESPGERDALYRALVGNMADAILILDTNARIIAYNQAFLFLFGFEERDVRNAFVGLTGQSDEGKELLSKMLPAMESLTTFQTEWNFRRRDGRVIKIASSTAPIIGANQVVAGYVGCMREVGGGERGAQESDHQLRRLAEKSLSLTGIFLIQDGFFRYVNQRFSQAFDYEVEELIDRMRPRDLGWPDEWSDPERLTAKEPQEDEEPTVHEEFRGVAKNGRPISIEVHGSSTTVRGRAAIIGTLLDITKRKEAEERLRNAEEKYRTIFENSVLGIFQTTPDGRFLSANHSVARILGYSSPEELMRTVADMGQFYVSQERRAEFDRLMSERGFVEGLEAEMNRKDGTVNWVSLSTRAVRDERGNTIYFEGTVEDITERKRIEAELLQAQKMEAIGTLAGGVAHDFNNLLMGIQGYTSLMLFKMKQGDEHYEKLKNMEQLVRSGADLTKQLLGFAMGGRYQVKVTDLREILKNISAMFMRTKREIIVHERYEDELYQVDVDQGQIEQAFLNLYVNAWQAMPGGGHLYIEARNVVLDRNYVKSFSVQAGKYVKVSVTDTGIGMDEKTMQRVFEPFFTTKEMGRGTGLGLASVYGIVKGHKGIINVYSQVGHGTTFNVYFPASKKVAKRAEEMREELLTGKETVLLVDDEETIVSVGREMLQALGYSVITASGGHEAIEIYRSRNREIDLVILDMIMPDLEGGKTLDAMKEINPGVKVILSSGYSLNSEAEAIMQRGCDAFMQKPFNVYALSQTLRDVIDRRRRGR
jgi:two-component system cell cycle sensor histidine kinase/response regulator CckA